MSSLAPLSPAAGKQWVKRYNFPRYANSRYALVAYIKSPAGEFVEKLRQRRTPTFLTSLPTSAFCPLGPPGKRECSHRRSRIRICGEEEPPFWRCLVASNIRPRYSYHIYSNRSLRPAHVRASRKRILDGLQYCEEWPYIPHLTIAELGEEYLARTAVKPLENAGTITLAVADLVGKPHFCARGGVQLLG